MRSIAQFGPPTNAHNRLSGTITGFPLGKEIARTLRTASSCRTELVELDYYYRRITRSGVEIYAISVDPPDASRRL
jgi:hypothetical protein